MLKKLKQWFCSHKEIEYIGKTKSTNGVMHQITGAFFPYLFRDTRCKRCGKLDQERWLDCGEGMVAYYPSDELSPPPRRFD